VPAGTSAPNGDGDDAWATQVPVIAGDGVTRLSDSTSVSLRLTSAPRAGQPIDAALSVRNADGSPATLAPWLGMAAHLAVVRTDGRVFLHVHPSGTGSMAAQARLIRREAGDTTNYGEQQPMDHAMHAAAPAVVTGDVRFPLAFPSPGSYRVFAQWRRPGRAVQTAAIDVTVADSTR
jgi:hypothetical protein